MTGARERRPDAILDALRDTGVTHLFGNFGSDHPDLIESLARSQASGRNSPRVVICPFESVGLAAAHGHTLVSGQAQAVVVHCDVGTHGIILRPARGEGSRPPGAPPPPRKSVTAGGLARWPAIPYLWRKAQAPPTIPRRPLTRSTPT